MLFYSIIVLVSLATALLPVLTKVLSRYMPSIKFHRASIFLPIIAGTLFFISFFLPDIHISNETSTFQQHFIGGGLYAGLLYYYVRNLLATHRIKWWHDAALLFMWVSALSVASELLEFFLLKSKLMYIDTTDTQWDLLANTLGAFVVFGANQLARQVNHSLHGHKNH